MKFCITGTGRCGTNLLQQMCSEHPDIFVFNETHWIPKLFESFGRCKAPVSGYLEIIKRVQFVTGTPVCSFNEADFLATIDTHCEYTTQEFCDAFGLFMAKANGKRQWADKTPDYGPYLSLLQSLWPDCKIIHLVRNGIEVADSMSRHPGFQWMVASKELWWVTPSFNHYYSAHQANSENLQSSKMSDYLDLWFYRLRRIQDELQQLREGSVLEIRFEELIHSPEVALRNVSDFLQLEGNESWISRAATKVDPSKTQSKQSNILESDINARHRMLLTELGY